MCAYELMVLTQEENAWLLSVAITSKRYNARTTVWIFSGDGIGKHLGKVQQLKVNKRRRVFYSKRNLMKEKETKPN